MDCWWFLAIADCAAATMPTLSDGLKLRAKELKAEGIDYKLIIVGRKATQYFQRRDYPIVETYAGLEQIPTASEAAQELRMWFWRSFWAIVSIGLS